VTPASIDNGDMALSGEYEPSPHQWVRDQVQAYEASGGREANTLRDTGLPIVVYTMRGHASGKVRKLALMRVEHDGDYLLVGSQGGAPTDPKWVANVRADPHIQVQDGPEVMDVTVRELSGEERATWWERAVAAFPNYADYQKRTERQIPIFVATPASGAAAE
jgi:deazaflavin-dependent oxidoreductase (nitroreductase family)